MIAVSRAAEQSVQVFRRLFVVSICIRIKKVNKEGYDAKVQEYKGISKYMLIIFYFSLFTFYFSLYIRNFANI
jgi:hypothetical protein